MTEPILLRGAMSFLILCNNKHGPAFCRAMLSVIDETGHLHDSDDDKWGKINYSNGLDERPEDESKWYNILLQDSADVLHWYRQFYLNWEVVLHDLQVLSNEKSGERPAGILFFKKKISSFI